MATGNEILNKVYDESTDALKTTPSGTGSNSPQVQGTAASGATDSGNPVKVGGKYNATLPTLTDGQRGDLQLDSAARAILTLGTLLAGEDLTNDVIKTEQRFQTSGAITTDTQVKSSSGFVHTVTIAQTDAAPTAGTIDIYDNTAGSGTKIFSWNLTTAVFSPFTVTLDVRCANGIYVDFTTTADVAVFMSYR